MWCGNVKVQVHDSCERQRKIGMLEECARVPCREMRGTLAALNGACAGARGRTGGWVAGGRECVVRARSRAGGYCARVCACANGRPGGMQRKGSTYLRNHGGISIRARRLELQVPRFRH